MQGVSGSVALVVLFPYDGPFEPDNIDIFVPANRSSIMIDYVRECGYSSSSTLPQFNIPINPLSQPPASPFPRGVTSVRTWYNDAIGKRVNLYEVVVDRRKPFEIIVDFHNTLLMNAITYAGVCCAYPELTLAKLGVTRLAAIGLYPQTAKTVYEGRGFRFVDGWRNPVVRGAIEEGHNCYTYRSCPRLGRWARSQKGFLWISFDIGTDLDDIVPDFRWCFFPLDDFFGFYPQAGTTYPCDPFYPAVVGTP